MRRRSALSLLLVLLGSLATATVVLGGGWAQVTVVDVPADPPAGAETTLELTVLQHGETPVSWPTVSVIASDTESGAAVRTDARAEGPTGSYVATIVFPSAGDWALTFDSTDLIMDGGAVVHVVPQATPVSAATGAALAPDVTPLALAFALAVALLGGVGLARRSRRDVSPEAPASARG